jgi:hypothetical protein
MDWKALGKTLLVAVVNAAIGAIVHAVTGSTEAAAVTMAGGTAVAHGLQSPFTRG